MSLDSHKFKEDFTPPLLKVKGLSVYIRQEEREKQILDRVSFQIKRGRFTALMGRSGIGKTLALKAILGILRPPQWKISGDIIFFKKKLVCPIFEKKWTYLEEDSRLNINEPDYEKKYEKKYILKDGKYRNDIISELRGKNIFAILQGPDSHLHPSLTIRWQIAEMVKLSRSEQNTTEEVKRRLQNVKINPTESGKYPHQFAQGQRQRIMMAMALGNPDLIIADEPTSALDIGVKKKIIGLLKNLRDERKIKSFMLITHDLKVIEELLEQDDDIIVMDEKETGGVNIVDSIKFKDISSPWVIIDDIPIFLPREPHPLLSYQDFKWLKKAVDTESTLEKRLILRIMGLKQSYRKGIFGRTNVVLRGIDLEVKEGEFLGIIGESGCGKTTLVKSLVRLLPNTKGRVYYYKYQAKDNRQEFDLIQLQPNGSKPDTLVMRKLRRDIQVIFQDSASIFNPNMTLREILSETLTEILRIKDPNRKLIEMRESLLQLGICRDKREAEEILSKYSGELSGGERQRLAIARVFLLNPRLIIADEPFADQDKVTKEEILRMMIQMRKINGTTFVIISHDLNFMKEVCDRIAILKEGRVDKVIIL